MGLSNGMKIEKYPVILRNISGVIVLALGPAKDTDSIKCQILDTAGISCYHELEIIDSCYTNLFTKYNGPVKIRTGQVLQNIC